MLKIILDIDFPSLNHVINETKKGGRGIAYSKMKKELTNKVKLLSNNQYKLQGSPKFESNACFLFQWYSKEHKNKQIKDPDNTEFATKFILDGFTKLGLFPDDSYKYASGIKIHKHYLDKDHPRVEVFIQERDEWLEKMIVNLFKNHRK